MRTHRIHCFVAIANVLPSIPSISGLYLDLVQASMEKWLAALLSPDSALLIDQRLGGIVESVFPLSP